MLMHVAYTKYADSPWGIGEVTISSKQTRK